MVNLWRMAASWFLMAVAVKNSMIMAFLHGSPSTNDNTAFHNYLSLLTDVVLNVLILNHYSPLFVLSLLLFLF